MRAIGENNESVFYNFSSEPLSGLIENLIFSKFESNPPLHFISAHALVEGAKNAELYRVFETGSLICDSKPLSIYLSRFYKRTPQVRGADFTRNFLLQAPIGSCHFFLGGTPETLQGIQNFVRTNRGDELSCIFESPDFEVTWSESAEFWISTIENAKPDFVWVGMGAPKQFYIAADIYKSLSINCFSVGAAFDFVAGSKRECPKILSKIGLEWMFRLLTEPRRLWKRYLIGNIEFLVLILKDMRDRNSRDSI